MLRCLECNVPVDGLYPTKIFGDNIFVNKSAANPAADISKKHLAISFYSVREVIAAHILEPYRLKGYYNIPDICTKQLPAKLFCEHYDFFFWRPNFYFRTNNCLHMDYKGYILLRILGVGEGVI